MLWVGIAAADDLGLQAARQQFARAEEDEDAGRWSDALEKLRSVFAVKQTAGVRYHIALCEEHLGKLADALADYSAADGEAHAENAQDVLKLVGKRLADLQPRVPQLTIHVVPDAPDASVTLDGAAVAGPALGTAMRVDPGLHRVDATAPGRAPSSAEITMREHDVTVLDVRLAPAEVAISPPIPEHPQAAPQGATPAGSRRPAIAWTIAAIALAGGGGGAYVAAGDARNSARSECALVVSSSAGACDSQKQPVRAWDWIAAGAWAGAAAASALAVISWTSPRGASASSSARVLVGLGSVGVGGDF